MIVNHCLRPSLSWKPELFEGPFGPSVRLVDADLWPLVISYGSLIIWPVVFIFSLLWLGEYFTSSFLGIMLVFGLPGLYKAVRSPITVFTFSFPSFFMSDFENACVRVMPHCPKQIRDSNLLLTDPWGFCKAKCYLALQEGHSYTKYMLLDVTKYMGKSMPCSHRTVAQSPDRVWAAILPPDWFEGSAGLCSSLC